MIDFFLYLFFLIILGEFTLRVFIETNFLGDENILDLPIAKFLLFRLGLSVFYLICFMVLGNNLMPFIRFILYLTLIDLVYFFIEKSLTIRFPLQTFSGFLKLAIYILIAVVCSNNLNISPSLGNFIQKYIITVFQTIWRGLNIRSILVYALGYLSALHFSNCITGWILKDLRHGNILKPKSKEELAPDSVIKTHAKADIETMVASNNEPVVTNEETNISLKRAGRYIGSMERIFVITFMLLKQYVFAVGFIFTAKTIARFELMRREAEYYLVGTLVSLLLALGISLFMNIMLGT